MPARVEFEAVSVVRDEFVRNLHRPVASSHYSGRGDGLSSELTYAHRAERVARGTPACPRSEMHAGDAALGDCQR
jgi:hypothetical protein